MGQGAQRSSVQLSPDLSSVTRRRSSSNNEYFATSSVINIRPMTMASMATLQTTPSSANSNHLYDHRSTSSRHVASNLTTYADLAFSNECYAEVQYTFQARDYEELSMYAGQYVQLIDRQKYVSSAWCLAININSQQQGLIPKLYLREVRQIETEEWFFGTCSRIDADEYLSHISNARGAFLVRVSERDTSCLALSMRDLDETSATRIKHYKIKTNNQGRFLISVHQSFPTVKALIHHHKTHQTSLNYYLQEPCRRRPARYFPSGQPPDLPHRQFPDATQPQNGFQPKPAQPLPVQNFMPTNETNGVEPLIVYPNLLQVLASELMPSSRSLLEPRGVDRSLQQLVEYAPTTIEVSECEDEYQSREDVLLPNIEEDSEYSKRPPSIKTLPPSLLLSGGFPQRPQSDMLSWEPLETQPKTEPDEDEDEDVFEAVAPNVQLVQQTPVEIMALQSILLQRKLGDGYFGDVWTGILDGKEVTLLIVKPPQKYPKQEKPKYSLPVPKQRNVN